MGMHVQIPTVVGELQNGMGGGGGAGGGEGEGATTIQ